jgi:hypothetical protein
MSEDKNEITKAIVGRNIIYEEFVSASGDLFAAVAGMRQKYDLPMGLLRGRFLFRVEARGIGPAGFREDIWRKISRRSCV